VARVIFFVGSLCKSCICVLGDRANFGAIVRSIAMPREIDISVQTELRVFRSHTPKAHRETGENTWHAKKFHSIVASLPGGRATVGSLKPATSSAQLHKRIADFDKSFDPFRPDHLARIHGVGDCCSSFCWSRKIAILVPVPLHRRTITTLASMFQCA